MRLVQMFVYKCMALKRRVFDLRQGCAREKLVSGARAPGPGPRKQFLLMCRRTRDSNAGVAPGRGSDIPRNLHGRMLNMDTDTVVRSTRRLALRLQSLLLLLGLGALAQSALAINVAFDGSCATQADRTAVSNAVAVATTWSSNAYNQVNNNEAAFRNNQNLAYRTWFGTFNQDRYQRVRAVLDGVRFKLNSGSTLTAYCRVNPNDPCDAAGDIAATFVNVRGDVEAWFCTAFFALPPRVGFDTQAGSVVHELTHSIGHTDDIAGGYGVAGAQNLAANRPSDAVENADNYEYYAEDLYD